MSADDHAALIGYLPFGATGYTVLRHVSRSGAQRRISLVAIIDTHVYHLDYLAARMLGRRCKHNGDGIVCRGGGMDMGFDLVYSLARELYNDGYALNHKWI